MINSRPEIRFEGFTSNWEQRKLEELADFSKGNGYTKNDLTDEGKPIILYGRLYTNYETVIESVDTFTNEKENSVLSESNEVIIPSSGETSEDISRASVVSKSGIILGGDLNIVRPNTEIDSTFLALTISNGKQQKELSKRAQGKSVVHLHNSDLKEINLLFPKKEEQTKIGDFFKKLDDTITLHQCKYEKNIKFKKAMLQKMFPRDGENVPEIRFQGFTDNWERRNIIEICKVFIGLVTTMTENYRETGTLLIRNSDIKENKFEFTEQPIHLDESFAEKNNSRRLAVGDVITVHTGDVGTSAVITEKERGAIGFATINSRPNPEFIDSYYLATFFNTERHKNYAVKMSTGDGRSNYNLKDFNRLIVPVPSIEEQRKIGKFFKQLDETIALYQERLNELKQIKKAMLQKMFV